MHKILSLSLLGLLLPLCGCSNDGAEDFLEGATLEVKHQEASQVPHKLTIEVLELGASSATIKGTFVNEGNATISRRGVLYSTTAEELTIGAAGVQNRVVIATGTEFSYKLSNLKSGTALRARTYIIYKQEETTDTLYSETVTFTPVARVPEVETLPVFNSVKRAAIVCGKFTAGGDDLKSYGVCIGRDPLPTVEGTYVAATDTATDAKYRGTFGVFFDDLGENTLYHVRAYAITKTDTVYGANRIFRTTQGGDFNWQFNNIEGAKADGAYERILEHVDSAMYYYRNYTNLNKYLWVNYSPGTPTADCNIEGWMRVGENARYQWVGTIQHEMCHALGVGTASNWNSFGSPWDKPEATLTLRVMMKDMSVNVHHDGMHFWPGGINQQEEVTQGTRNDKGTYTLKGALMLKANAMIINAMREDGLTTY